MEFSNLCMTIVYVDTVENYCLLVITVSKQYLETYRVILVLFHIIKVSKWENNGVFFSM